MIDYVAMLKQFHNKFNLPTSMTPTLVEPTIAMHKIRLLLEELSELVKAVEQQSLLRVADSVTDLLNVGFSTAVTYGLPIDQLFEIVHNANMKRDIGFDSNGKIPKGANYTHPAKQIGELLQQTMSQDQNNNQPKNCKHESDGMCTKQGHRRFGLSCAYSRYHQLRESAEKCATVL